MKNDFDRKNVFENIKVILNKKVEEIAEEEPEGKDPFVEEGKILSFKVLIRYVIAMVLAFFLIEPILSLIYDLILKGQIMYTLFYPIAIKVFAVWAIFVHMMYKYMNFTYEGRKIFPYLVFLAIAGLTVSLTSFNYISEDKIVEYRLFIPFEQKWEDISHVEMDVYRHVNKDGKSSRNPTIKYYLVTESGKKISAWSGIKDNLKLHEYLISENIRINYNKRDLDSFIGNYKRDFKKDMPYMICIFYGEGCDELDK